jgi:SAM-dependent methyltransferase
MGHFHHCPSEEERRANYERARVWLMPLLSRLGLAGKRVLNVGCGVGTDVALLAESGWDAWGINPRDPARGTRIWEELGTEKRRFVVALGEQIPFRDDTFDACISFEVVEHVGKIPPAYWTPAHDCAARRQAYADECVRVTKHGGTILLSTPNKWFPLDAGHGFENVLGARLHSPFEDLLVSPREVRQLFRDHEVTHAPLSGYFRFERSRRSFWRRHLISALKMVLSFGDTAAGHRVRFLFPWLAVQIRVDKKRPGRRAGTS